MKRFIKYMAAGVLALGFASCNQDHVPDWTPTTPAEFDKTEMSIAEGQTVPSATSELRVTYAKPIVLNQAASITLNDSPVSASVKENVLTISLSLASNTKYTIKVPGNAVAGIGTETFAPGFTLNFSTEGIATDYQPLSNPNAMEQARKVYEYLISVNGTKILSGAMANVNNNNDFADWLLEITGKYPAITGYDFIHLPESTPGGWVDYEDTAPAEGQWQNNGLVSYMWHWRVPTSKEAWESKDTSKYGCRVPGDGVDEPTDFDIREALREGTWENQCILADIDRVAIIFKQLEAKGIPVIWRPLHEAAGSYQYGAWFWWGRYGSTYTTQLWKLMRDRLENHHGLKNLIWVWTAQYEAGHESEMFASYPGNDFVDFVGTDIYASDDNSQMAAYNALNAMVEGKRMVTISETGLIQNPEKCIADGAKWSWFNLWYTYDIFKNPAAETDDFGNTPESLRAVFNSPYVINRDQMPSLK